MLKLPSKTQLPASLISLLRFAPQPASSRGSHGRSRTSESLENAPQICSILTNPHPLNLWKIPPLIFLARRLEMWYDKEN